MKRGRDSRSAAWWCVTLLRVQAHAAAWGISGEARDCVRLVCYKRPRGSQRVRSEPWLWLGDHFRILGRAVGLQSLVHRPLCPNASSNAMKWWVLVSDANWTVLLPQPGPERKFSNLFATELQARTLHSPFTTSRTTCSTEFYCLVKSIRPARLI